MEDLDCAVFPERFIASVRYFINFPNPILYANIHIFPCSHDVCYTLMYTRKYSLSVVIFVLLSSTPQHTKNNPPNFSDYIVF